MRKDIAKMEHYSELTRLDTTSRGERAGESTEEKG